ncbi:MAG: M28 family peptidase [Caulobacteraceae bacterium]|nr:M28 family peptidase [Caulobacteraceae bacterium]
MKAILFAATLFATPALAAAADFDAGRLSEHIRILSADDFEGRGPATPAEAKTVDYISRAFAEAGLQPGGDKGPDGRRTWTQDVPLAQFDNAADPVSSFTAGGQVLPMRQRQEIAIRAMATGEDRLSIKDAPVVFIGYGVKAPERNWDDYKGVDLKGKVALVLVNDPDFEGGEGDFGGKAMTYYGRWTYKYEEAARQGALGYIVIHETAPASYGWPTVTNSNTIAIFDIVRQDPKAVHAPLEAWVQRDVVVDLFKRAGLDFEKARTDARSRAFRPVELKGVTFSAQADVDHKTIVSKNVVGVAPGTDLADEYVLYTSHWDHLGIGPADANGDTIYNGAADNAAGTAGLIELARAFAHGPRPRRTVIFNSVTAEEKGLLGSEYYAANPLYPLGRTAININMDGLSLNGPARDVVAIGQGSSEVDRYMEAAAKANGQVVSPDPRPEAGSFFRSDQFSLVKRGVPAMYAKGGQDLVDGGRAAGKAAADDYVAKRYHQPDDEFNPNWNYDGAIKDLQLQYAVGRALADSGDWPAWTEGAEFKAARDASASERR